MRYSSRPATASDALAARAQETRGADAFRSASSAARVRVGLRAQMAALIVATTLGAGAALMTALLGTFDRYQESLLARQRAADARQLAAITRASAERLQRMAEVVPALTPLPGALERGDRARVVAAFADIWDAIGPDTTLSEMRVYHRRGPMLFAREGRAGDGNEPPGLEAALQRVLSGETPTTLLHCAQACEQYVLVPILGAASSAGVVVLVEPLALALVEFARITGADVAVLTPDPARGAYRVSAMTHAPEMGPRFEEVARALSVAEHPGSDVAIPRRTDDAYDVSVVPLEGGTAAALTSVAAVLREVSALRRQRQALFLIALGSVAAGAAAAIAGLLGATWGGVSRIVRASRHLPALGERDYPRVRAALRVPGAARLRSELDDLEASILALADRLEGLDLQVARANASLTERADELARQRDLVAQLFDAAPAALLTLDENLRVVRVNRLIADLTGREERALRGSSFPDLCLPATEAERTAVVDGLRELLGGARARYEHEGTLAGPNGEPHTLAWIHVALPRRAGGAALLGAGIDVTQQRLAQGRAQWLADHDPLTGLLTLDRFRATAAGLVARERSGALLVVNVDHFKYINERGGYRTGDAVLTALARGLVQVLPSRAVAGRIGGNEFAALLPGTGQHEIETYAAALAGMMSRIAVFDDDPGFRATASAGIALYPEHGDSVEELLANGLAALSEARESGPGGWLAYSSSVVARERMRRAGTLLDQLRRALAANRLVLYYQPIVDLRTFAVTRHEALVRLRADDDTHLLPPGEFIPIAERYGLITQLDQWVMNAAIEALARMPAAVGMSVNLSGPSLRDRALPQRVITALARAGIAPQRLVLEVTETAAVQDMLLAGEVIEALRGAGCRFALDDFGVGFSSLTYLRELPVDFVKIDGAFIRGIARRPDDQPMVRAINDIAHGLGKRTVAEFVDSEETLAFVRDAGIDYAQGFHLGRPAPQPLAMGTPPDASLPAR
jgi:diguanylate cyclase (GGDEF)-like protein/PAS domain S-box-containing protein